MEDGNKQLMLTGNKDLVLNKKEAYGMPSKSTPV
jgi:hypothetical protein